MAWIAVVTNAGRALLDSYAAGGHTLNLTGATVGSGVVADANLRIQTEITDEKDTASIISAKEVDDGVKYKIQVGPASDSVGAYTAHQIGIWANLDDGADTLLMLAQDAVDGIAVPLASVSHAFAFAIFIAMTVDNTEELTVEIDETAYVTIGTLQEAVEDIKATPFVVSIPTGQWSGSGSDYYITINATNVTPDSILIPNYDSQSESRLKGPVWCVPGEGSFTIHTTQIPSNTVEILIQFFGVKGEAQYQVLADVYSKSQTYSKTETDSKIAQSTAFVPSPGNAGFHNSIYRGKYLGTSVTAAQYAAISAGTFDHMFIGDYWVINSVTWRIAGFDYWLHCGDTECTTHHVVIVPDTNLASAKMNNTNITTGGYVGSDMYTGANSNTGLSTAKSTINSAFGSAHILNHRQLLSNAVADGKASAWSWYDSTVDLMNESMVYGSPVSGAQKTGDTNFNVGIDHSQLPLFRLDNSRVCNRAYWWLRDVASAESFAFVYSLGFAYCSYASNSLGVRPAFGIRA